MNRVSSHSNDEKRMKILDTTVLARSLLAPYGGGEAPTVAQWSGCGCDNAFAGTQYGTLWTDKLWWGIS